MPKNIGAAERVIWDVGFTMIHPFFFVGRSHKLMDEIRGGINIVDLHGVYIYGK
jgi:hypothetical protein